jgi:hypothetical protein
MGTSGSSGTEGGGRSRPGGGGGAREAVDEAAGVTADGGGLPGNVCVAGLGRVPAGWSDHR